jgi:hypothetical protein
VLQALAGLEPGGGTRILPAIHRAATMLESFHGSRHIVLVTDGRGEGGDFDRFARQLLASKVTLSVVAVGDDADVPRLEALARAGGGRFELATDARKLSVALRREIVLARGPVVHEQVTPVVAARHPVVGDLTGTDIPPLLGYVSAAPKPFAAVPIRTETGEPILALGAFGLGRAAALLTTLDGPWGAPWRSWTGMPELLARSVMWVRRDRAAPRLTARQERDGDGTALVVIAEDADGRRVNVHDLRAHLTRPGESTETVELEPRGPGWYAAPLTAPVRAPTRVVVEHGPALGQRLLGQGWIGLGYPEEFRLRPPNGRLLAAMRDATGGRSLDGALAALELRTTGARLIGLVSPLVAVGLGLFILDLVLASPLAGLCRRGTFMRLVPRR